MQYKTKNQTHIPIPSEVHDKLWLTSAAVRDKITISCPIAEWMLMNIKITMSWI